MKIKPFSTHSDEAEKLELPLMLCLAPAGWTSPAEDYVEKNLNINDYIIKNPESTYLAWASGDSMIKAGIFDKSLMVIDRAIQPASGRAVVAIVRGELLVKYFKQEKGRTFLVPGNTKYKAVDITGEEDAAIWGVVTYVIHKPAPLGACGL